MKWSFSEAWNKALETRNEREIKPRNVIWASELGGSYIDRYLKMLGEKPTNPPNARSLRKFEAGNMMEWVVEMVLRRAGIFIDSQEWIDFQYPNLLKVNGKLDQLAGGKPDWNEAEAEIKELGLPDFFRKGTEAIIKHLSDKFPDGLENIVIEVKSCSSFMFEKYESTGSNPNHQLQLFHYLKAKNMDEGHIVYISKDDLRMLETAVFNTEKFEKPYKEDIEKMTYYVSNKIEPDKEPQVVFEEESNKFYSNWKIEYSSYLTKLYGYEKPDEYRASVDSKIARWNRVLGRIKENKNMTKNNLEAIAEMEKEHVNINIIKGVKLNA